MSPVDKTSTPWVFSDDFEADRLAEYVGGGGAVVAGVLTGNFNYVFPRYQLSGQPPESMFADSFAAVKINVPSLGPVRVRIGGREDAGVGDVYDYFAVEYYQQATGFPGFPSFPYMRFRCEINPQRTAPGNGQFIQLESPFYNLLGQTIYVSALLGLGNRIEGQLWVPSLGSGPPYKGATSIDPPGPKVIAATSTGVAIGNVPHPQLGICFAQLENQQGGSSLDDWHAEVELIARMHLGPRDSGHKRHVRRVVGSQVARIGAT